MSLLTHIDQVAFASTIPMDLILGTYSGSVFCAAPAATPFNKNTATVDIQTNIPETTFFQGIFSIDGGITWLDFNSQIPNSTTLSFVVLQTQMMYGISKPGTLTLKADNWSYFNGSTTTSASYTFMYKVVIFARPGQGAVTPQPVVQAINFNTAYNYQKISRDSAATISIPVGTANVIVAHNLGYIPKIRNYVEDFSYQSSAGLWDYGYFASNYTLFTCAIDNTNVTYFFDNSAGIGPMTLKLYTRIYYDS